MVILPLPFIRSIGLGGMLIPAVSILSTITLLPAMLALLGPKINRRHRPAQHGHPAAALHPLDRARRHADPGRLDPVDDHAPAGDARAARPEDQPSPSACSAWSSCRCPSSARSGSAAC